MTIKDVVKAAVAIAFLPLFLVAGYFGTQQLQARFVAQRAQEEAARQEAAEVQARTVRLLDAGADGDIDGISDLISDCMLDAEDASSSVFYLQLDRRSPSRVRALLDGLHPWDTARKIEYLSLPELQRSELFQRVANEARVQLMINDDPTLRVAVTYGADSFSGIKDAWGILECSIVAGELAGSNIDLLYLE